MNRLALGTIAVIVIILLASSSAAARLSTAQVSLKTLTGLNLASGGSYCPGGQTNVLGQCMDFTSFIASAALILIGLIAVVLIALGASLLARRKNRVPA